MTIKEKLKLYSEFKGLSMRQFSRKIGVSDAFLRTKDSISSDLLPSIKKAFTDLNTDWLIFDKEHMILLENSPKVNYKKYIEVME